jgi:hypothetical protein
MCAATASTSAGSQSKSGKPCDRLIAPRSAASFDITVKIVVPTLGSLDLIDTYVASKTPVWRFLRTAFHGKWRPFMATYTPAGSVCTNDSALTRLNSPSELQKA